MSVFGAGAAGAAVWCLAGWWLSSRGSLAAAVERQVRWVVPWVFIAPGAIVVAAAAGRRL
ncbi:hypothetical protein AB5J72_23645 [Streptomyces sp. CG1]|uniref:hypothetical protein n=1 Tax=Streptomyces sp. CG1 TaxID=1287523 RepID=UPI0034E1DF38